MGGSQVHIEPNKNMDFFKSDDDVIKRPHIWARAFTPFILPPWHCGNNMEGKDAPALYSLKYICIFAKNTLIIKFLKI